MKGTALLGILLWIIFVLTLPLTTNNAHSFQIEAPDSEELAGEWSPADAGTFFGKWIGIWDSYGKGESDVEFTISNSTKYENISTIDLLALFTNPIQPYWQAKAKFVDGALVVDQGDQWLIFRPYGEDRLRVEYRNLSAYEGGVWSLIYTRD